MTTLAERLQKALDAKPGASQAELARFCKTSAPSVSDWFTGETKTLKAKSLVLAAEFLEVRARWLLDGVGPMRHAGHTSTSADVPLPAQRLDPSAALEALGIELARDLPDDVRQDVADALHKLAMRHGAARDQRQVLHLLADSGKQAPRRLKMAALYSFPTRCPCASSTGRTGNRPSAGVHCIRGRWGLFPTHV